MLYDAAAHSTGKAVYAYITRFTHQPHARVELELELESSWQAITTADMTV